MQHSSIQRWTRFAPAFGLVACFVLNDVAYAQTSPSKASDTRAANTNFDLGPWRQYLAQQLDPGLPVVDISNHSVTVSTDWKLEARLSLLPDFARALFVEDGRQLATFSLSSGSSRLALDGRHSLLQSNRPQLGSLQQNFLQPGIVGRLDDDNVFSVGLVLASQQYGAATLDQYQGTATSLSGNYVSPAFAHLDNNRLNSIFASNGLEFAQGIGFQFGYSLSVFDGLELTAGYQSRIDTEALNNLRGVYANPADLDTPSRISANLGIATSPNSQLQFGVEHVNYSSITAFGSSFLPGRFLSLLGDSDSPSFNWDDVIVYSARWSWAPSEAWNLQVEYSTRTQPLPDVGILADALRPELADSNFGLFFDRRTCRNSLLRLGMSYAPAEYAFGGNVLGVITDDLSQNVEVDLSWQLIY